MSVGTRLRSERERLGLSQADFAERTGIHRNTLVRYETDKRELGTGYIETLRSSGADVDYVLFGLPDADAPVMCPFIAEHGCWPEGKLFTLADCRHHAAVVPTSSALEARWWRACQKCPKNPVTARVPIIQSVADLDGALLASVLEGVDAAIRNLGVDISHAKKAKAVVMLYRSFKAAGTVDQGMIEETVTLAAS